LCGEDVVGGASALQAVEERSSNGETVHFEPLEIQRHREAGFTLSDIEVTVLHETNQSPIARSPATMEQQKQLQSLTNEYQSLQNGMPPRDRDTGDKPTCQERN
jgi:DNA-binding transcriptional MerR regulator